MFKINLVPEVQEKKQQSAKVNSIVITVSAAVVAGAIIALIVMGGIDIALKTGISSTDNNIADTKTEIAKYAELEKTVISLEKGLADAKGILDGKNAWTKLLPNIEAATPNDVRFTKLDIDQGKITASLAAKDVNGLARFVQSFKTYRIISLSGTGQWGDNVDVIVDGGPKNTVPVKSNGSWNLAIITDPTKDHKIVTTTNGETTTVSYTANGNKFEVSGSSANAALKNLFSAVEVSQYSKTDNQVNFNATLNYDGGLLW